MESSLLPTVTTSIPRGRPPVPDQEKAVEVVVSEGGLADDIVPVLAGELGGEDGCEVALSTSEDSEGGSETRLGAWDESTDRMSSGSSSANVAVRDRALVFTGEIAPRLAFPWANVIWMPGDQPMEREDSRDGPPAQPLVFNEPIMQIPWALQARVGFGPTKITDRL